jgi:hypothetical protein
MAETSSRKFVGPRLKLQRAKHHIADYITRAEDFYRKAKTKFFIQDNRRTGVRALCIDVDETVPEDFPLIIGDAIHNLRSALDHLTWDVVSPHGPPRPGDVQFPFCRQADAFEGALSHRQIHLTGEKTIEKFRSLKPYPGGDDVLYALHQLDIADKHQLVLTVRSLIAFDYLNVREQVEASAPPDLVLEKIAFTNLKKDNRIAAWRIKPGTPVVDTWPGHRKPIDIVVQVMFRSDQPLGGQSVSARLNDLAITVEKAIDSLS